jgi:coproporphyrinogen III oxidase-like Fe-S oxidoreductase
MDLHRYEKEYGTRYSKRLEKNMTPLLAAGLLDFRRKVRLTDSGILLSNEAASRLSA